MRGRHNNPNRRVGVSCYSRHVWRLERGGEGENPVRNHVTIADPSDAIFPARHKANRLLTIVEPVNLVWKKLRNVFHENISHISVTNLVQHNHDPGLVTKNLKLSFEQSFAKSPTDNAQ